MTIRNALVATALACVGCGGSNGAGPTTPDAKTHTDGSVAVDRSGATPDMPATGGTTVAGTVSGETFGAPNAIWAVQTDTFGGMTTQVDVTDAQGVCAAAMANAMAPAGHVLAMSLYDASGGPVTAPATLAINAGLTPKPSSAMVHWSKVVAGCVTIQEMGMTGEVKVTSVDSTQVSGTFDIVFATSSDHLTGTFVAPNCAALATWNPPVPSGC
jgi:hypothetical protein